MDASGARGNMKIGLTLGKFAPFHKGHEYLISCALKEMDEVIVVVYNASETTDIPTRVRANWIKSIFPKVRVILAEDGPQVTGYTKDIIDTQNEYLKKKLKHINVDTFYSSENYGEYVSTALKCKNRIVDISREQISISATDIRENVVKHRDFLSPVVFNSIKPYYYFLGGPSTGKSTITLLAAETFGGSYCEEYGREYWMKHQKKHRLSMKDLEKIAFSQNELELTRSNIQMNYTFCDTNTITTLAYSIYYFNKSSKKLLQIVEQSLYKYKNVFLCNDDFPFDDTWDRSGIGSREKLQEINIELLQKYQIKYSLLSGTIENRLEQIKGVINA